MVDLRSVEISRAIGVVVGHALAGRLQDVSRLLSLRWLTSTIAILLLSPMAFAQQPLFQTGFECHDRPWDRYFPPGDSCAMTSRAATGLTQNDLRALADAAVAAHSDPANSNSFWTLVSTVAAAANCTIERPECAQSVGKSTAAAANKTGYCQTNYCDDVSYCGPGDSQTNLLTAQTSWTSSWFNHICFDHDRCYDAYCQSGAFCTWSLQDGVDDCDRQFFDRFVSGAVGSDSLLDAIIAAVAASLKGFHQAALGSTLSCGTTRPCEEGLCTAQAGGGGACLLPRKASSCSTSTDCLSWEFCFGNVGKCIPYPAPGTFQFWSCTGNAGGGVPFRTIVGPCESIPWQFKYSACAPTWCADDGACGCRGNTNIEPYGRTIQYTP
jgi:hypothetical protein